jgi:hypothetical protein
MPGSIRNLPIGPVNFIPHEPTVTTVGHPSLYRVDGFCMDTPPNQQKLLDFI